MSEEGKKDRKKLEIPFRGRKCARGEIVAPLNPVKILPFVILCVLRVQLLILHVAEGKQYSTRVIWNLLLF